MKKPNLFIVGFPRSGTGFLNRHLNFHPDIFMSSPKEPNFFCTDFHKESDNFHGEKRCFPYRTKKEYLQLYSKVTSEKILGDSSTHYIFSKVAAKNIYEFNPKAKIIICLRNPVDFLYSLHESYYFHRYENIKDFEKALEAEEPRKKGKVLHKGVRFPSSIFYMERIKYVDQIKRYYQIFPKKQIKLVFLENIKKNPKKVYVDVLTFLGVDSEKSPEEFVKVNKYRKIRFNLFQDFLFIPNTPLKKFLKKIVPRKIYHKIWVTLIRFNRVKKTRVKLTPDIRKKIMEKLKPEVVALSKFIKKDLKTLWGY